MYQVTVTDSECGEAKLNVRVEYCPGNLVQEIIPTYPCLDSYNGTIKVLTNNDGKLPLTWVWKNKFTSQVIDNGTINQYSHGNGALFTANGFNEGIFELTLTDSDGCTDTEDIRLYNSKITIESNVEESCDQGTTINLSIEESFANPPLTYLWNDGVTNKDRTGLTTGEYCITVTDANNCEAFECFDIETSELNIKLNDIQNESACFENESSCDGSIDIIVDGGIPPYSYTWDDGVSTEDRSSLCSGTYKVTVVDVNGCQGSFTAHICCCNDQSPGGETNPDYCYSYNPDLTSIDIKLHSVIHPTNNSSFDGEIKVQVSGGTYTYTYSWTGPNGYKNDIRNISNLDYGTYCLTVSDGCNQTSKCFTLKDCDALEWVIQVNTTPACSGYDVGSIEIFNVSGAQAPYSFLWQDGRTSQAIHNLSSGQYCVTITDADLCETVKCWTINTEEIQEYWQGCTYIKECGDYIITDQTYPVFEVPHPTDCYSTQIICSGNGQVLSTNYSGYYYSFIDDCTLGQYNAVTNELCDIHYGQQKSEVVSGCTFCPNGAYCGIVSYCDFYLPDGTFQRNIYDYQDILVVTYAGYGGVCTQINYCHYNVSYSYEICRCFVDWSYCLENITGDSSITYSMSEVLNLKDDFTAVYPIIEHIIVNDLGSKLSDTYYKDIEIIDVRNDISYTSSSISSYKQKSLKPPVSYKDDNINFSDLDVSVYPNPTDGIIYINLLEELSNFTRLHVKLLDVNGKICAEEIFNKNKSTYKFNISSEYIPNGVYLLSITSGNKTSWKKIIKQ